MKSLNELLYNEMLEEKEVQGEFPKTSPMYAYSKNQNVVRVYAPFDTSWTPFGVFQANNEANNITVPNQKLYMHHIGEQVVDGVPCYIYEVEVPYSVLGNSRATRVEFNVVFYANTVVTDDDTDYTSLGITYYDTDSTQTIEEKLSEIFDFAGVNDFVRVVDSNGESEDWVFDGNVWTNTNDTFVMAIQESVSEIHVFELKKGKLSGYPTKRVDNTMAILNALDRKADKTSVLTEQQIQDNYLNRSGDSMNGILGMNGNAITDLAMLVDGGPRDVVNRDYADDIRAALEAHKIDTEAHQDIRDDVSDHETRLTVVETEKLDASVYNTFITNFDLDGDL